MKSVFLLPKFIVAILVFACIPGASAQPEPQSNFSKMRKDDFSKLIGGIQEGGKLQYNNEKTVLEGSGGKEIKKYHLFIQGTGSIGTTTNLSNLFSQKALPTFSGSLTLHWLIPGFSKWFYDGTFARNYAALRTSTTPETIDTKSTPGSRTEVTKFTYREALQDKINKGTLSATSRLYTHKRFFWLSASGKYDNTKYAFYNANATFDNQLSEPIYNAWTGKLSINGYIYWNKTDISWSGIKWRPNFIYLNFSAQYGLGNNIQQLKKTTVNDVTSSTVNGNTTRQVLKSQSVYNGTFKQFKTLTPSFELIFSPFRSFAVIAFGEHSFINSADRAAYNMANYGSIATGVYFYGDGNSKINVGAFYKWTKDNATDSWTEQIGLKTTIPIAPL